MTRSRLLTALAIPAAITLALVGCSTGGSGGGSGSGSGSGSGEGGSGGGGGIASCVQGHTWNLDVQDLAGQLLAHLQSNGGSTFVSATGSGTQTMNWGADGTVDFESALVIGITANMGDGLVMTLTQKQTGPSTGTMTIDGSTAQASDWTNGVVVDNTVDINGTVASAPMEIPSSAEFGSDMTITCSGSTMTTHAEVEGNFATQKWTR